MGRLWLILHLPCECMIHSSSSYLIYFLRSALVDSSSVVTANFNGAYQFFRICTEDRMFFTSTVSHLSTQTQQLSAQFAAHEEEITDEVKVSCNLE